METQNRKKIDNTARQFITSAYKLGISTLLIDRFLRESNYNCTMITVHDTLHSCDLAPDGYNCSFDSLVWRRYLTNILQNPEISTLGKFKEVALQEAIDYYNINETTFVNYREEFIAWTGLIQSPLDINWIMNGTCHFGFTFTRLSEILSQHNINVSPTALHNLYNTNAHNYILAYDNLKLRPKIRSWPALREFWILCHKIGKEISTILEWTEIFTGTGVEEAEIDIVIRNT